MTADRLIRSICILSLFAGFQSASSPEDKSLPSACQYHLASLGSEKDSRNQITFDALPKEVDSLGKTPLQPSYAILFSAPTTRQDLHAIYPHDTVTQAHIAEMNLIKKQLKEDFGRDDADRQFTSGNVGEFVSKHSTASYLIFVGHNENALFRFMDGSSASFEQLYSECRKDGKARIPIFISCRSKSKESSSASEKESNTFIGSDRDLDFWEAFCITRDLSKFLDSLKGEEISPTDLQTRFNKSSHSVACHATMKMLAIGACGGAAAILGLAIYEHEKA